MVRSTLKQFFPVESRRGRYLRTVAVPFGLAKPVTFQYEYQRWIQNVEPEMFEPIVQDEYDADKPLFSIVIPFYNTPEKYLTPLLDSITGQAYQNWELIVADASTDKDRAKAIFDAVQYDERLKYHRITRNEGISGNTNQALGKVRGRYVVFCDHDDTLSPQALNEMAVQIEHDKAVDILYSDEDKLTEDGKLRHSPFFKPKWSPHLFMYTNYTNHLSVIRRELVEGVGGLRPEFDGSQDYDLILRIHRASDKPLRVAHVNKVLYHWREARGSTAVNHSSKSYAFVAGANALQEYMDAGHIRSTVENIKDKPGYYLHKLTPQKITKAEVYVSVSEDSHVNEIVAGRLQRLTDTSTLDADFRAVAPSELDKYLGKEVDTDTARFQVTSLAYPREKDWLVRLCGALELPDVSAIAPRILMSDSGRIADVGIMYDRGGNRVNLFKGLASEDLTPIGGVEWMRDVDELSGSIVGYPPRATSERKYNVVWSYVMFRAIPANLGESTNFSSNVFVNKKGKIEVNG